MKINKKEVFIMRITKKKNIFTRLSALLCAAFMTSVLFVVNMLSLSVSAADETAMVEEISVTAIDEEISAKDEESTILSESFEVAPLAENTADFEVVPLAAGGNSGSGSQTADSTYKTVINFFITWLRRIGAAVALVGAIMFGLAIKNNDAEQKQAGLITMIAGFVVAAICQAADMFDLFT